MNILNLNPEELDILREAGNIGCGNSVTSLSILLEKSINMSVVDTRLETIYSLPSLLGPEDECIAAVTADMDGDINATFMIVFETESAEKLVQLLLKDNGKDISNFTNLEVSALKEVINILGGTYINALAQLTGLDIGMSTPQIYADMAGAILAQLSYEYSNDDDSMLLICTEFTDDEEILRGRFIIVLEEESYSRVMSGIRSKLE